MSKLRKRVLMSPEFEMDPLSVPISDFPIDRMQAVRNFNNVCYNAAVDFVDGYGQDSVRNSKGGQYCETTTKRLIKAIGKDPCQYRLTAVPVIDLRPKFFSESLGQCKGNPEKALQMCIAKSEKHKADPRWCKAAYTIYKNAYEDKMPKLPQSYAENYTENLSDLAEDTPSPSNPAHSSPWNWLVPVLIGCLLAFLLAVLVPRFVSTDKKPIIS